MPGKLRMVIEKCNQPLTMLKIWDQVQPKLEGLEIIQEA
jgi:hypothetical protein